MDPEQVFRDYTPLSSRLENVRFCPVCGAKLVANVAGERHRLRCPACDYAHFQNPLPGAVVLVVDGDRFLLCRRSSTSWRGKWCLPSGVVECDEDFLTAAIREVKEETGLDVQIGSILTITSNF